MIAALLLAPLLGAAPVAQCERDLTLAEGTAIRLLTAERLSSKRAATGDMVALTVAEDVKIDGVVAIPAGTPAKGQITDASGTGALGTSGKLALRPLYLQLGETIVRLDGRVSRDGGLPAGTAIGMVAISGLFGGRTAQVPVGSSLDSTVRRTVTLHVTLTEGC